MYWNETRQYRDGFTASKIEYVKRNGKMLIFDIGKPMKKRIDCKKQKYAERFIEEFARNELPNVIDKDYIQKIINYYETEESI